MFHWLRTLFSRTDPPATFVSTQAAWLDRWFRTAATAGKPKWLTWTGYEVIGEPLFVRDLALMPVMVRFEPVAGAPLDDVPHAREPRAVVAVFRYVRGRWTTDGRTVFNLTPQQVAGQVR